MARFYYARRMKNVAGIGPKSGSETGSETRKPLKVGAPERIRTSDLLLRRQEQTCFHALSSGHSGYSRLRIVASYQRLRRTGAIRASKRVSEQVIQASWNVAVSASATASLACVETWHEDFRKDLTRVDVPTLVIHGDADRILPISASGLRTARLIKDARLLVVQEGPHCVTWTHADEVNSALVSFLGEVSAPHTEAVA